MKEFLVNNMEIIFSVIGILVMILSIFSLKWFDGTKYQVIAQYYILFLMAIGTIKSWSSFAEWLLK